MTKPSKALGELFELFYQGTTKVVPDNISQLLTSPLALAVWYMDDGTLDRRVGNHFNPMIATYGFSFEDCIKLSNALNNNFDVKSSVTRCTMRGKVYPRLYIQSASTSRFLSIIKPFVQPVFNYKIGLRGSASSSGNT